MASERGLTLTEVVILVALVVLVAAIVVPSLLRARMSAGEASFIGDTRTVGSAEAAYNSAAGAYGPLTCLSSPSSTGCISGYSATQPTFLDSTLASLVNKGGYARSFVNGAPQTSALAPSGMNGFCYDAVPAVPGGRSVGTDASGRLCWGDPPGAHLCGKGPKPWEMPATCAVVQ